MRARVDVSEIEAQTKIRAKYLRALENEEWSLLPGPIFVKSFLRTYAQALDLDGKALVEEYRLTHERPSEGMLEPIVAPSQRSQRSQRGRGRQTGNPSRGYTLAVGAIVLVIVVLVVLLVSGGSPKHTAKTLATTTPAKKTQGHTTTTVKHSHLSSEVLALQLRPTGPVYVCLIGENGRKLIPGLELQAGEATATYHAKHFEIALGNNAVTMSIDGIPRAIPASSQAIGYSITKAHGRRTLAAGQIPTCK